MKYLLNKVNPNFVIIPMFYHEKEILEISELLNPNIEIIPLIETMQSFLLVTNILNLKFVNT